MCVCVCVCVFFFANFLNLCEKKNMETVKGTKGFVLGKKKTQVAILGMREKKFQGHHI